MALTLKILKLGKLTTLPANVFPEGTPITGKCALVSSIIATSTSATQRATVNFTLKQQNTGDLLRYAEAKNVKSFDNSYTDGVLKCLYNDPRWLGNNAGCLGEMFTTPEAIVISPNTPGRL